MSNISDAMLDRLCALARVHPPIDSEVRAKLVGDLRAIVKHVEDLAEVDTTDTEPLAGGGFLSCVSREDVVVNTKKEDTTSKFLLEQFSDQENGYLKVPPVF